jgi:5-methylcytosine-specific restriction enzyme A
MPTRPKTFRPAGYKPPSKTRPIPADRGPYKTKWWLDTRKRIALRDMYQCRECGKDVGKAKGDYHCDHIEPRPVGASVDTETHDSDGNLQTLCATCHNAKTGREGGRTWG